MQQLTINDIRKFNPCYDPAKYLPEDWTGTALDILNINECPANDRIWVVCRNEFYTDRELRIFAVWCARQALAIPGNENEVCSKTCDVAERYANGHATDEELNAARNAARDEVMAARDAVLAASDASSDAAIDTASDAAWAAIDTASAAESDAAWAAAWAAIDTASAAAMAAARNAQIEKLKDILINGI